MYLNLIISLSKLVDFSSLNNQLIVKECELFSIFLNGTAMTPLI